MKKSVFMIFILCSSFLFSSCSLIDQYKGYEASGFEAKTFPLMYEDIPNDFQFDTVHIYTTYEEYAANSFGVGYTKGFFEKNNLIVFTTTSCSSDQMEYREIKEKDGKLYPVFMRNNIPPGAPVTCDFILMSYCVEVSKDSGYGIGNIIFEYR